MGRITQLGRAVLVEAGMRRVAAVTLIAFGALGGELRAEEASADPIETRVAKLEEMLGFKFGGMLYGSYQYNFNEPETDRNTLRSFDQEDNNFTLDVFQLAIEKEGPDGLSATAKLNFGKTSVPLASDWNGDGVLDNSEETNDFEVQDAFLNYAPEWAGGISVKAGKFATVIGAELIEAPLNPNFTRSFAFGFAIPFTHTGVLFSAPLGEMASTSLGVVNGWDNVVDSNDSKTFIGQLALTPTDLLAVYLNGSYGNESVDDEGDARGLFDLVVALNPDPFMANLNFDYGTEGDGTWLAFAGIVGVDLRSAAEIPWGLYLRGEIFDDQDGFRTGTEQQLYEVTATAKYFLTDNLTFWLELRHDGSDEDSFVDEGTAGVDPDGNTLFRFTDTQTTALVALSYVF
jgi:hypothetical protein